MTDSADISGIAHNLSSNGAEGRVDLVAQFVDCVNWVKQQSISLPNAPDLEDKLIGVMKIWGTLGEPLEPAIEAKMVTVAKFISGALHGKAPCPDPRQYLTGAELTFLETLVELGVIAGGPCLR